MSFFLRFAAVAAALVVSGAAFGAHPAAAQSAPPQSLYGSVNSAAGEIPEGTKVEAYIGDMECSDGQGTTGSTGTGDARVAFYAVNVMSAADVPGCGTSGATVRIKIGDEFAEQTAAWEAGVLRVHVTFGDVPELTLPTSTPVPATNTPDPNATATPNSSDDATADPETAEPTTTTGPGTPTSTPRGELSGATAGPDDGAGSSDDDGGGFPIWGAIVIALAVIAGAGGGIGYLVSRNSKQDPEDTF